MTKYLTYAAALMMLMTLGSCNKKQSTTAVPSGDAASTQRVDTIGDKPQSAESETDSRPTVDEFKTIKSTKCWVTTKKNPEEDAYLGSMNELDLKWPTQLAGCEDLSALHHALVKLLFGKESSASIEAAVSGYLDTPAYQLHMAPQASNQVSTKHLVEEMQGECTRYDRSCQLRLMQNSPTLITFEVSRYEYSGGAHGYGASDYLMFDRQSGRLYTEANVFMKPQGKKLLSLLNRRIKELGARKGVDYMMAEEVPTFYPTAKGLTFVFPPYAIASYAEGEVQIDLSYATLKNELTPEFNELVKQAATFKLVK